MKASKIGNWDTVTRMVRGLEADMLQASHSCLTKWCLKAEATAKLHMSAQDLNWTPLNPDYLQDKIRQGLSENTLIATSDYFQAITSYVSPMARGNNPTGWAGVKKAVLNADGEVIADIAKVHEYGSRVRNIPARPLWQPTYAETVSWIGATKSVQPTQVFKQLVRTKYKVI